MPMTCEMDGFQLKCTILLASFSSDVQFFFALYETNTKKHHHTFTFISSRPKRHTTGFSSFPRFSYFSRYLLMFFFFSFQCFLFGWLNSCKFAALENCFHDFFFRFPISFAFRLGTGVGEASIEKQIIDILISASA